MPLRNSNNKKIYLSCSDWIRFHWMKSIFQFCNQASWAILFLFSIGSADDVDYHNDVDDDDDDEDDWKSLINSSFFFPRNFREWRKQVNLKIPLKVSNAIYYFPFVLKSQLQHNPLNSKTLSTYCCRCRNTSATQTQKQNVLNLSQRVREDRFVCVFFLYRKLS